MQVKEIATRALDLLAGAPNDSGVFVRLSMIRAGNLLDQSCHGHDYELSFTCNDGRYKAEARRVVGMWNLSTVPPDTATVASVQSATLAGLHESCGQVLAKLPNVCADYRINFHISEFARYGAPETIVGTPDKKFHFSARYYDPDLWDFAVETATRAIVCRTLDKSTRQLSLWFHPESTGLSAIYFTMRPARWFGFSLSIDDRVPFPWRKCTKHVWSVDKVGEAIADYLCRNHAGLAAARVYYGYGC